MTSPRAAVLLLVLSALLLGGCATITTSSSQTVTVTTDPAGAACTFKREGQVIGIINPTPGSLMVGKSHTAIDVACAKEGYVDASGTVGSKFQAMTLGNILLGGIIGIAVDAASGATAEYEPQIAIVLTPSEFADAQARDRFFDRQRESFTAQAKQARARIAETCEARGRPSGTGSGWSSTDCDDKLRRADEEEQAGLVRIESQRQTARIRAS